MKRTYLTFDLDAWPPARMVLKVYYRYYRSRIRPSDVEDTIQWVCLRTFVRLKRGDFDRYTHPGLIMWISIQRDFARYLAPRKTIPTVSLSAAATVGYRDAGPELTDRQDAARRELEKIKRDVPLSDSDRRTLARELESDADRSPVEHVQRSRLIKRIRQALAPDLLMPPIPRKSRRVG